VRRAVIACALALLAAGCAAAGSSSVTVSGSALTIYASAPLVPGNPQLSQDVLDAEQLALQQAGSQFGRFNVKLVPLTGRPSDNARTAIQDTTAIAYLGEIAPGASADSLGITNAQDLLQVSPTDTALELTQPTSAVSGSPGVYYESLKTYNRTFARVVPSTALEAKAQIQEMRALGVRRLYVADDGSPYGKAVALAVRQDASPAGVTVVSSQAGADAVFYGASSATTADRTFDSLAQSSPTAKLFGPSALGGTAFAAGLSADAQPRTYVSAPGFLPKSLTAAGRKFVSDFTAAYHHAPAEEAIFGYEAMAAVMAVLHEAGSSANNRATVVHDFFAIRNRSSALGTYSINVNGDTNLGPFVFSRFKGGTPTPFRFVQVQG
jgi:ABC-type branched-subunit amino acid transport system substrate-binding protein